MRLFFRVLCVCACVFEKEHKQLFDMAPENLKLYYVKNTIILALFLKKRGSSFISRLPGLSVCNLIGDMQCYIVSLIQFCAHVSHAFPTFLFSPTYCLELL